MKKVLLALVAVPLLLCACAPADAPEAVVEAVVSGFYREADSEYMKEYFGDDAKTVRALYAAQVAIGFKETYPALSDEQNELLAAKMVSKAASLTEYKIKIGETGKNYADAVVFVRSVDLDALNREINRLYKEKSGGYLAEDSPERVTLAYEAYSEALDALTLSAEGEETHVGMSKIGGKWQFKDFSGFASWLGAALLGNA